MTLMMLVVMMMMMMTVLMMMMTMMAVVMMVVMMFCMISSICRAPTRLNSTIALLSLIMASPNALQDNTVYCYCKTIQCIVTMHIANCIMIKCTTLPCNTFIVVLSFIMVSPNALQYNRVYCYNTHCTVHIVLL